MATRAPRIHPVLKRQLKESGITISKCRGAVRKLVERVSESYYEQFGEDATRKLRSHEVKALVGARSEVVELLRRLDQERTAKARRELVARYIEKIEESRGKISAQADLLRQQAEEIAEARDDAIAASRLKSEFLANISHEIQTPMNGILGMLRFALHAELSDDVRECLEMAQNSAVSLLSTMNGIVDLAKIEAGELELQLAPLSLREVARQALSANWDTVQERRLSLVCQIDPDLPELVVGDGNRVRQVLINLLGNAVKFTDEGEVVLHISAEARPPSSCRIKFTISDTGIGMTPEQARWIFEPFAQADASIHTKFGGVGLGLSISQRIVRSMGGEISVVSHHGKGSTFSFLLDLEVAHDGAETAETLVDLFRKRVAGRSVAIRSSSPGIVKALRDTCPKLGIGFIECQNVAHARLPVGTALFIDEPVQGKEAPFLSGALVGEGGELKSPRAGFCLKKPFIDHDIVKALNDAWKLDLESLLIGVEINDSSSSYGGFRQPLRILVADDINANRLVAKRLLEQFGHHVELATDGCEALKALEQHGNFVQRSTQHEEAFDLVLLDIEMPNLDGVGTAQQIRRLEAASGRRLAVVALTAHALRGDRERFLAAGMDDYLSKPLDPHIVFNVAAKLLPKLVKTNPTSLDSVENDAELSAKSWILEVVDQVKEECSLASYEDHFNAQDLVSRYFGDPALIAEICAAFLGEINELCGRLASAMASGDCVAIASAAHAVKGSSLNVCAGPVYEIAREIELSARKGTSIGLHEKFAYLSQSLVILIRVVARLVERLSINPGSEIHGE